jgi:hypothetical protein
MNTGIRRMIKVLLLQAAFICAVWSVAAGDGYLGTSLTAMPSMAIVDDTVTVKMTVTNITNTAVTNVLPVPNTPTVIGSSSVFFLSGPNPASVASIGVSSSAEFTWTYKMLTAGTAIFSCGAQMDPVYSGAGPEYGSPVLSNEIVTKTTPTPTTSRTDARISAGSIINPLKGETVTIIYELKNEEEVRIIVFSRSGRHIKTLVSGKKSSFVNSVSWDGSFEDGKKVGEGIYIIYVKIGGYVKNLKVGIKM